MRGGIEVFWTNFNIFMNFLINFVYLFNLFCNFTNEFFNLSNFLLKKAPKLAFLSSMLLKSSPAWNIATFKTFDNFHSTSCSRISHKHLSTSAFSRRSHLIHFARRRKNHLAWRVYLSSWRDVNKNSLTWRGKKLKDK